MAASGSITAIVGAEIVVITDQQFVAASADAQAAGVADGADVTVITRSGVVGYDTSQVWVTSGICAGVFVVTVGSHASGACARFADVPNSAGVAVLTGQATVVRNQRAVAGEGVASSFKADGIGPVWSLWAVDNRGRVDDALVRKFAGIANQRAVAKVTIFKCLAVVICLAITRNSEAGTVTITTDVGDRTGIAVIAGFGVGR